MVKKIKKFFKKRFDIFYRQRRLRLILDVVLIAVILGLIITIISLYFYRPQFNFNDWFNPKPPVKEIELSSLEISYELEPRSIKITDDTILKLKVKNIGGQDIENLNLNLETQNENFSIIKIELMNNLETKIDSNLSSISLTDKTIIIDKLAANTEREVSLKLNWKKNNQNSRTINWFINTDYTILTQKLKKNFSLPEIIVATLPSVTAHVYYNSPQGDQLGSGPLPPVIGLPTNVWIFITAKTDYKFRDLVVSGRLAKNVKLVDNSSLTAGNLVYSADSRNIIWQLSDLDASSGELRAAFEVQLIPSADQLNFQPSLFEDIKFQAKDELSGLIVNDNLGTIDTSFKDDLINQGSGRVRSLEEL